jgi:hypothetical protein
MPRDTIMGGANNMCKVGKKEVVEKINDYLKGKVSKGEASAWAIKKLTEECFHVEDTLIEDAITALSLLHDEDERFDTAQEDLIFFKDCLLGEKSYGIKLEFLSLREN